MEFQEPFENLQNIADFRLPLHPQIQGTPSL